MGRVRSNSRLTPFGRWVKTQALNQDTELREIASRVGISKNYLSMILHGSRAGEKYKVPIVNALGGNAHDLRDIM